MSFDRLAPHYRWMEWILAGEKLQRCRQAFLPAIPAPQSALLLGEGNGRFLVELLRVHPRTRIACVDSSAAMLERARRRLHAHGRAHASVQFIQADARTWSLPRAQFDLIVSHFFLDCFPPEQLGALLKRLAHAATPEARWLVADFREPAHGWRRWRARAILTAMYRFFRLVTRLPADRLSSPDPWFLEHGFVLEHRRLFEWGLLHSDCWVRNGRARSTGHLETGSSARAGRADGPGDHSFNKTFIRSGTVM